METHRWISAVIILFAASGACATDLPALLQWSQRVELSTPVSGTVRRVYLNPGDHACKGQALLALDSEIYQARVAETTAAVARSRQQLAEAKRDLERMQALYDRGVNATSELDQAKLRLVQEETRLREAEARLLQDAKNLRDTQVRAPFDGVVVARFAEPGQTVVTGLKPQVLLVFARDGEMLAQTWLPYAQAAALKRGQPVTVRVGEHGFPGTIRGVSLEPVASSPEQLYAVDAVFKVKPGFRAGAPALIRLD